VRLLGIDERFGQKKPVESPKKKVAQRDQYDLHTHERSMFQVHCFQLLQYHFEKCNKAILLQKGGAIEDTIGLVSARKKKEISIQELKSNNIPFPYAIGRQKAEDHGSRYVPCCNDFC
jgi:hypothetical protein